MATTTETASSTRLWIVAGIATAIMVAIIVAVAVGVQHQRERACEFQKAMQGYDASTAAMICHNGG